MAKRLRNSNPKRPDPEWKHSSMCMTLLWALAAVLVVKFIALVFKLSGDSLLAVRMDQILLGTAAVALVYLTARRWFSKRVSQAG